MDYISAINAYQKIVDANRKIKPSRDHMKISPDMVLRKGDDLVKLSANTTAPKEASKTTFEDALANELIKKPISTLRTESKRLFQISKEDALTENQKVLELVKMVDTMDATVKGLVAVRDKIVSAYLDVLKMPI